MGRQTLQPWGPPRSAVKIKTRSGTSTIRPLAAARPRTLHRWAGRQAAGVRWASSRHARPRRPHRR
uniref:Uncharacterized protein n=1 Tax=uncultured delta proteobacterium HF0010_01J10 TaxID=710820 RepID=E0XQF4_9DELT|nr:hypothetical protein [uncultured delta proteobacterium HF0010_01J10]